MQRTRREFLGLLGGGAAGSTAGCVAPARNDPVGERRFAMLYEDVAPSVARVQTTADGRTGQGSGFRYRTGLDDDDSYVVTNQHVVGPDPDAVRIQYADGEWVEVAVVGTDPYSDLAVLDPGADIGSEPLPLRETVPPIGTEVLVVGSPLGFSGSASQGIISGRNRSIPAAGNYTIADAIQTDAALNPGNSGGPILTLDGDVVAVATARASGSDNVGFGVSAPLARRVVPSLIENGRYDHSHMGIAIRDVGPLLAEANDLPAARGVYVTATEAGGPADGVLRGSTGQTVVDGTPIPAGGDVIVGLGKTAIDTQSGLSRYLALETAPGDVIDVRIRREGSERTVQLELGTRPDPRS
ncbi:trypsin-like peptidase domain-containing protein [Halopenitus sp. POP-27]|uniref:S1C family serine protease n=1 Tax=Halopenitus sp. POP-27 TaxID=2994425 RepID=UPI002468EC65|nr:trypsin-like peptidase domain-containing protein [Halopenitus sp. POP-27]